MTAMLRDILGEPAALRASLAHAFGPGRAALRAAAARLRSADHVALTGIGASWSAALAVAGLAGGEPVTVLDASELLYYGGVRRGSAVVALSRSGRSGELVGMTSQLRALDCALIAITNTPDSPLAAAADAALAVAAPFDHNVSITMYTALLLLGGLLLWEAAGLLDESVARNLDAALAAASDLLPTWQQRLATSAWLDPTAPTYFLARGPGYATASAARLLWEEAAKRPATALTTGNFRHGALECLHPGHRIGLVVDGERCRDADLALAAELRWHGARVLLVGQDLPEDAADLVLPLPEMPARWQPLVDVIPLQLAAERLARLGGCDCDSFRLCAYVVESSAGGVGGERS